ncbi:lectin BRA-3-like [Saccoglossus kowalevskii]|uniref:Lectin BRA-3-like n=1 Tax=Saccoglossus kowalevskii TaxID=10224 RepID=A0ABM0GY33_SACKO|nr:PREDICTED: lectin BRA-3-like [Saccoglossus kowalevskii]
MKVILLLAIIFSTSYANELKVCSFSEGCKLYTMFTNAFVNYDDAKDLCQNNAIIPGNDLLTIRSQEEFQLIRRKMIANEMHVKDSSAPANGYWIGLDDIGHQQDFRWDDGTSPTFTPWAENNPNNLFGDQNCVQLWKKAMLKWDDDFCYKQKDVLCEKDICQGDA